MGGEAAHPAPTDLGRRLAQRIEASGPIRFDGFMDAALYDPDAGFYTSGGRAGARAGDFLTSPEVGPLFAAVLARAVDAWWRDAGSPDAFCVAEVGAGPGTLAAGLRAAAPACAGALTWVLVEASPAQRAHHLERLAASDGDQLAGTWWSEAHGGERVRLVSVASLPPVVAADVLVANELLDNLPVRLAHHTDSGWAEVWVDAGAGDILTEELRPLAPADELVGRLAQWVPGATAGMRVPVADAQAAWVAWAVEHAPRVVVFDYADTTASLASRHPGEWLRTYAGHQRGAGPLERVGEQDITCEVPLDQVTAVAEPSVVTTQAAFLGQWGIGDLVEEGRARWAERAHIGDLDAVMARSRVREAEALCDPGGLGAYTVIEWHRTPSLQPGPG